MTYIAKTENYSANEGLQIWAGFPDYVKKNGYAVPKNPSTGPFVEKFGMGQWDYFKANPKRGQSFNIGMQSEIKGQGSWLDGYPWQDRLLGGFERERSEVLLVDVGGNRGHDLQLLEDRKGNEPGCLILEDLPEVIADAGHLKGIEQVSYDFFTPQPIIGEST